MEAPASPETLHHGRALDVLENALACPEKDFLTRIGVTAAKPEDIAQHVISLAEERAKAKQNQGAEEEAAAAAEEEEEQPQADNNAAWDEIERKKVVLRSRVRAISEEMAAVAAGLQALDKQDNENDEVEEGSSPQAKREVTVGGSFEAVDGSSLQRALGTDRLVSLKRKKKQLQRQLKALNTAQDEAIDLEDGSIDKAGKRAKNQQDDHSKRSALLFEDDDFDAALDSASGLVETERDKLIRTGVLTPFDRVQGFERRVYRSTHVSGPDSEGQNYRNSLSKLSSSFSALAKSRPSTKLVHASELPKLAPPVREFKRLRTPLKHGTLDKSTKSLKDEGRETKKRKRPVPDKKWRRRHSSGSSGADNSNDEMDEGMEKKNAKEGIFKEHGPEGYDAELSDDSEELGGLAEDVIMDGGLKVPGNIYDGLFDYQKTGLKWLWELHCQRAGGVIGDEMGLGKTIQVIALLGSLHHSGMYKPSIVICPVTLLRQWRREVHKWYPSFNVEILHDSAKPQSIRGKKLKKKKRNRTSEDSEDSSEESEDEDKALVVKKSDRWNSLIGSIANSDSGLLITTYEQLRILREKLLDIPWGYVVLDEGHRIRNPDAEVTLVCKQLQTAHRIIMTGAPIQNKLTELWSLFDFVFPGKLGVLPVFQAQFALPIAIGGYANATPLQVSTAYRCAVVLRDLITPYLLRRMKSDVNANLPNKTEHVLFCSLTEEQRAAYRAFLGSSEVEQIFDGRRNSLYGIDILRKICNHPDLLEREHSGNHPDYGCPERSGKLKVVAQILGLWQSQGHRALIFTQTQQMLDIVENHIVSKGFVYRRMDGSTPVKQRMNIIDEFNESIHVFVLLLTTRVGGLGTNLIGANRVIIYDPDWNPSTDMQARERAWRIGQTKDVTIYRLLTRGTIEEKVYHRQIYKHFLTNKILKDPNQRRFFKARDMRDLFTLQDEKNEERTETAAIFSDVAGGDLQLSNCKQTTTSNSRVDKEVSPTWKESGVQEKVVKTGASVQEQTVSLKGKEKVENENEGRQGDESRILRSLFDAHGIHSAINHDVIMSMNDPERMKIDSEAAQIAERAAEAIRKSRLLRSNERVSTPTWTGRSGSAGAPVRRKFGSTLGSQVASSSRAQTEVFAGSHAGKALSSTDILARLREGHLGAVGSSAFGSGSGSGPTGRLSQVPTDPTIPIRRRLCNFINQNGGSVTTALVVEHFKDNVSSQDVPLFRQVLKEIADLKKGESSTSRWFLKDEYKPKDSRPKE